MHVLNVVDGGIPSDLGTGTAEEIEEERRLLYVAMTRAQATSCTCSCRSASSCISRHKYGDRHVYAQRSRFIEKSMLGLFEDIFWPPIIPHARPAGISPQPVRLDLGATMRGMWAK